MTSLRTTYVLNKIVDGLTCAICFKPFETQEERDEIQVYSLNPRYLVHAACYGQHVDQIEKNAALTYESYRAQCFLYTKEYDASVFDET